MRYYFGYERIECDPLEYQVEIIGFAHWVDFVCCQPDNICNDPTYRIEFDKLKDIQILIEQLCAEKRPALDDEVLFESYEPPPSYDPQSRESSPKQTDVFESYEPPPSYDPQSRESSPKQTDVFESYEPPPSYDPQSRESSPKQTDVDAMLNEILNPKNFKHLKEKEFVVCPEVEDDIPWNP